MKKGQQKSHRSGRGEKCGAGSVSSRGFVVGQVFASNEERRNREREPGGASFLHPSRLAATDPLLPVELFVEEEDQKVDIYFSSIK